MKRAIRLIQSSSLKRSTSVVNSAKRFQIRNYSQSVPNFHGGAIIPDSTTASPNTDTRIGLMCEIEDTPGALSKILQAFSTFNVNLTHIESRPSLEDNIFKMYIDFQDDTNIKTEALLEALKLQCSSFHVLDGKECPWFPRNSADLDYIANRILDGGTDLESDHPGFSDPDYRLRRKELASVALNYRYGDSIPRVQYTTPEIETWGTVMANLEKFHDKYACSTFKEIWPVLKKEVGYRYDNIPQAEDISNFLNERTGFTIRPCAGLLSSRDFLNGLAFRVFFSTQYLRHSSVPLYTPEPDLVHEFIGHVPMYADPDFADLSQEVGLASLGASDEEISKLAYCYWHSIEFGLTKENNELKAYGAGLLSSFGELEYACSTTRPAGGMDVFPEYLPWEPSVAATTDYPICDYQPRYFVSENILDAKKKMRSFCENMKKPFHSRYNPNTKQIWIDRKIIQNELPPIIENDYA